MKDIIVRTENEVQLSELLDKLQDVPAASPEQVSKMLTCSGLTLRDIGTLLIQSGLEPDPKSSSGVKIKSRYNVKLGLEFHREYRQTLIAGQEVLRGVIDPSATR